MCVCEIIIATEKETREKDRVKCKKIQTGTCITRDWKFWKPGSIYWDEMYNIITSRYKLLF